MHWVSNAILFVFLLELLVILYAMRPAQFFCACRYTVREDDLVRVVDRDTGNVRCKHAIVTHVNLHTGKACVRPVHYDDIDLKKGQVKELAKKRAPNGLRKLTMTNAAWESRRKKEKQQASRIGRYRRRVWWRAKMPPLTSGPQSGSAH